MKRIIFATLVGVLVSSGPTHAEGGRAFTVKDMLDWCEKDTKENNN
jgi:hypothetical protein